MFRWYRKANLCYTYLSDVPARPENGPASTWMTKFKDARWFKRGWTLQELIAPRKLIFYSKDWTQIGMKEELATEIESQTGIPHNILLNGEISGASIAQRMSWAAQRSTSRTEDEAYCLMGLFEVYMPMLYGEGERAFIRLQEEIIKTSDDMSIFAWVDSKASFSTYTGLLARSPSDFSQCKDVGWTRMNLNPPYQTTNKGISIAMQLKPRVGRPNEQIAILSGVSNRNLSKATVGIYLQRVGQQQYARIEPEQLALLQTSASGSGSSGLSTFFIREEPVMEHPDHTRAGGILIQLYSPNLILVDVQPSVRWNEEENFLSFEQPPAIKPPPVVEFKLQSDFDNIELKISVNVAQKWGSWMEIDKSWAITQRISASKHTIHCRRRLQPLVEIIAERGLFNSESKIVLSVLTMDAEYRPQGLSLSRSSTS